MAKTKIVIESASIAEYTTAARWSGELTHAPEREQIFFRKKMTNPVQFTGEDYATIMAAPDCEPIDLRAYVFCGDAWELIYEGTFTVGSSDVNATQCVLKVRPDEVDEYTCLVANWEQDKEVAAAGNVVATFSFLGEYVGLLGCSQCCRENFDPSPCDQSNLLALNRACVQPETTVTQQPTDAQFCPGDYKVVSCFHRIEGQGTPTTPPTYGSGWTLLSGSTWWRCPTFDESQIGNIGRGRLFNEVLTYLFAQTGCGLTLRSHFFNIAATHAAPPSNDAYAYAVDYLQHMTVHQKSDVKCPDCTNAALPRAWKMRLKKLLADLQTMFNVCAKIEGNSIWIEHLSYFEQGAGADYSNLPLLTSIEGSDTGPQREVFLWSDDVVFGTVFAGLPIIYTCGEGTLERRVEYFTTDLVTIRKSADLEDISSRNFVLISNATDGAGGYSIIEGNYPLGWQWLHDALHRHGRPYATGKMNNVQTAFESVRFTRKHAPFTAPLCCDEPFVSEKEIMLPYGPARIERAVRNFHTEQINIEPLV